MANPELENSEFIPKIELGNITREDGGNYVKEIFETHPNEVERNIEVNLKDVEEKVSALNKKQRKGFESAKKSM